MLNATAPVHGSIKKGKRAQLQARKIAPSSGSSDPELSNALKYFVVPHRLTNNRFMLLSCYFAFVVLEILIDLAGFCP